MNEVYGDAMKLAKDYDILCVTTNGTIKGNGECVMGRGIALEIARAFPRTPQSLGNKIKAGGNRVHYIFSSVSGVRVLSFPVKHKWSEMADLELIKRSCVELMAYADELEQNYDGQKIKILLPRPGCGNGKLVWEDVKQAISPLLDDRVSIVHWADK